MDKGFKSPHVDDRSEFTELLERTSKAMVKHLTERPAMPVDCSTPPEALRRELATLALPPAGMAAEGLRPVFAVYSTFMQRAVDSLIHDICLQALPVTVCLDRAGVVGDDGPTHHGVFDIALLRGIPGLVFMQPRHEAELDRHRQGRVFS